MQALPDIEIGDRETLFPRLAARSRPGVLRGIATDWPLVAAARSGTRSASDYLRGFYQGAPVTAFRGRGDTGGRIFYSDDLAGMNFEQAKTDLEGLLDSLLEHADSPAAPTIYMGSMAIDYCLPGLRTDNSLPGGGRQATVRIWIGNRSTVSAHYDVMQNVACVCAGRRRFTLFPPEQLGNLYVGPLEFTPAGQQVSLVDPHEPDLERYPRFAEALAAACVAELEPGDGIYIPAMWWHHVEGLESFNILINHWWREVPARMGAPGDALLHAILEIRDLPPAEREAWRGLFGHYVFDYDAAVVAHIPEARRGVVGELDDDTARRIRSALRNKLNR